ncbi:MAG: hypothetical protein HQM12_19505 [SAR324 cluster bacterium]|nr:hypothetical protein [SAR324 cluster bacterium]
MALAVIVAGVFMLIGWLMLAALLYGVMYVASHAREGLGLMHLVNILLMWVLGPGFGGLLATYITPRLFKTIDVSTIATSFISVVVTLAIVMGILSLLVQQRDGANIGQFLLFVFQVSAIVIGAKLGKSIYVASNA